MQPKDSEAGSQEEWMLDYVTLNWLIQEDRRREMASAARARLVRGAARRDQPAMASPTRRSIGRMLVRVGMWIATAGTASMNEGEGAPTAG